MNEGMKELMNEGMKELMNEGVISWRIFVSPCQLVQKMR